MRQSFLFKIALLLCGILLFTELSRGSNLENKSKGVESSKIKSRTEKIEGRYRVDSVVKKGDSFRIVFSKEKVRGSKDKEIKIKNRVRKFYIDTKQVHHEIQPGVSVDLEASVLKSADSKGRKSFREDRSGIEAAQILVNLETEEGTVPVWILSINEKELDLETMNYLKMHVPSTDFRVF